MCELGATGYMNNRGRQNVANLFAKARRPSSICSRSGAVSVPACTCHSMHLLSVSCRQRDVSWHGMV
jgi:hypothetical protein